MFSAQTPKPKPLIAPFSMVILATLGTCGVKPMSTPTLLFCPPTPVMVNPFRLRTTGPGVAGDMVMAPTLLMAGAEKVRFDVRIYVPGLVMLNGKDVIWTGAPKVFPIRRAEVRIRSKINIELIAKSFCGCIHSGYGFHEDRKFTLLHFELSQN